MIDEKRLKNYLLYAVGEIILVMVGILLALQVNNWNEARNNNQLQIKYLENIKTELSNNHRLMEQLVLNRYERKMKGLEKAKLFTFDKYQVRDTLEFLSDVSYGAVFGNGIEFLSSSVFEELKNTGNIQLISNDSLRTEIGNLYHFVDKQVLNVRYYVSGYQSFVNGLKEFDRNNPDSIAVIDRPFMLRKLKSEETILVVNKEITYGIQVRSLVNGIHRRTGDLLTKIDQELERLE